ncbi:MAG: phytoene/squalene synthase family protein [Thermoleophilia bacterium]
MRFPRRSARNTDTYLAEADEVMQNVSRTFSVAARLLPATVRRDVTLLYLVLRTLDDLVDEQSPEAAAAVAAVETWLVTGEPTTRETIILDDLSNRHSLPRPAVVAFLQGMRDDLEVPNIQTEGDLDVYCYRVAGAVGEMMASILGVWNDQAWNAARALGNAMQRTNILRDVDEDLANGRIYLARDTLDRFGITDLATQDRTALYQDQIARAETLYDQGMSGIPMLIHGGRSIAAAGSMYREILREIERGGYGARRERSVVSRHRKALLVGRAFTRPKRWS